MRVQLLYCETVTCSNVPHLLFSVCFQLKKLRGLVHAGAAEFREFNLAMRYLDLSLQTCIKDLRSSLVREVCITIS